MAETLTPQQLSQEGQAAYKNGRYVDAARLFDQAARGFHAAGDELTSAENLNNSSVAWLKGDDPAAALAAATGTDQIFAAAGDTRRQGMALANQAAALESLNRLPEALETYNHSSDLLKQAGDKELRSIVLQAISALQLRSGNQLQALASMDSALDNKKRLTLKEKLLKKLLQVPFNMIGRK